MKKIFKNNIFPLMIKKSVQTENEINIWDNKIVFFENKIDINSFNIDSSSSAIFLNSKINLIPNLTINSGELLLIDRDSLITENILINSGGEMRLI